MNYQVHYNSSSHWNVQHIIFLFYQSLQSTHDNHDSYKIIDTFRGIWLVKFWPIKLWPLCCPEKALVGIVTEGLHKESQQILIIHWIECERTLPSIAVLNNEAEWGVKLNKLLFGCCHQTKICKISANRKPVRVFLWNDAEMAMESKQVKCDNLKTTFISFLFSQY